MDRIYIRSPGHKAHAFVTWTRVPATALAACGVRVRGTDIEEADRLQPDWKFCGRCSRIVAARTDIEEDPTFGNQVAPI